jgi:GST-like protein
VIDVYTWPTPNGHKVHIFLEETGLEYSVIPINFLPGDQLEPEFLKISRNNKMPAKVDQGGPIGKTYAMFESGAMLLCLAEKTGQFMPRDMAERYTVM